MLDKDWIEKNVRLKTLDEVDGHCETIPTDAAGIIAFEGATRSTNAHFARLSNETSPEITYHLLKEIWKLETPTLLISVTGSAKGFHLPPKLKKIFSKGLLKVAQTQGAWVITGGTNTGVMKHVGETLKGATKSCIGIATWGYVREADHLQASFHKRSYGEKIKYEVNSSITNSGAFLDHNHTHFLLADDGSCDKSGKEIEFRSEIEKYIMQKENVPCVVLVLQGGFGTLDAVLESVKDTQVPVVIIKGSGGAADCLAYAIDTIADDTNCFDNNENNHQGLYENIKENFGLQAVTDKKKCKEIYEKIIGCVKTKHLMTVFRIGGGSNVDEAILKALLNIHDKIDMPEGGIDGDNLFNKLKLCILWNRPDIAQDKLFSCAAKVKNFEHSHLNHAMLMSLALNRAEFVQILLEYGVSIMLRLEDLELLYGYRSKINSPMQFHFIGKDYTPFKPENDKVQQIFQLLCSYQSFDNQRLSSYQSFHNPKTCVKLKTIIDSISKLFPKLCKEQFFQMVGGNDSNPYLKNPHKYLFFWAVLNNMQDMALCFWEFETEGMLKALATGYMCRELTKLSGVPDKLISSLNHTARVFEDLAVNLLEECSIADEEKTEELIGYRSHLFYSQSCLTVAVEMESLEYVSHSSVQNLLNRRWTCLHKPEQIGFWSICKDVILPFYIKKIADESYKEQNSEKNVKIDNIEDTSFEETCPKSRLSKKEQDAPDEVIYSYKVCYQRSPLIKFYKNVLIYIAFICVYSYVAMLNKHDKKPHILEYVAFVFVISFLVEEISQCHSVTFDKWWSSYWNLLDVLAITLSIVSFGLHFWRPNYGHISYSLAGGLWILRLLNFFDGNRKLGPYIVMIHKMFIDMMYFMVILLVFLVAYGVSVKAFLHPKSSGWYMMKDMMFQPYFNIYGELFLDGPDNVTTRFGTTITDKYSEPIAWLLLGAYLFVANVLLLNLLIAIFNNTYNEVQENSEQIWKYKFYSLVMEYEQRTPLIPPFNILYHMYCLCKWIICRSKCIKKKTSSEYSMENTTISSENDLQTTRLLDFESECMASLMRKRSLINEDLQIEKMQEMMDRIKEDKIKTDYRLKQIEEKLEKNAKL